MLVRETCVGVNEGAVSDPNGESVILIIAFEIKKPFLFEKVRQLASSWHSSATKEFAGITRTVSIKL